MRPSWRPRSTRCGVSQTTSTRKLRPSTGPAKRTEPLRMKPLTIRTSFAWAFSEQTLQQLVQLAAAVLIARLLTPEEMGTFALAYAASAVLTALRSFGVGQIGRASRRESVCPYVSISVGAVSLKKTQRTYKEARNT